MPEDSSGERINFVKEAFQWQYNLIGLGAAALFALVSVSALPLLLAAGLELIYLSTIPNNKRFQRLVRSWKYADEKRRQEMTLSALFNELPPEMRTRYADLNRLTCAIRDNYKRLSSTSQIFVEQIEAKLEGLSRSYLRLLNAAHHHREYLRNINPDGIRREVQQLTEALERGSPKVQEINRKRIEILNKRLEKYARIRENRDVIDAQCAAVEDVLALIRDQSVTMRDPQRLSDHLESLIKDVENTEDTVKEVEAIFELASPEMDGMLSPAAEGQAGAGPDLRARLRN